MKGLPLLGATFRTESMLKYYETFAKPKWIEVSIGTITLFTLPLVIGKNTETRTYQLPAFWEQVSINCHETRLEVYVQLENKIKVMDIWTRRCRTGQRWGQHNILQLNELIATFHQWKDFGVTGLGDF